MKLFKKLIGIERLDSGVTLLYVVDKNGKRFRLEFKTLLKKLNFDQNKRANLLEKKS